jgi:hypothetical protein
MNTTYEVRDNNGKVVATFTRSPYETCTDFTVRAVPPAIPTYIRSKPEDYGTMARLIFSGFGWASADEDGLRPASSWASLYDQFIALSHSDIKLAKTYSS